jgi:NADH:ubiquinone oxidoreductase subunit F (NADH-binding)
MSLTVREHDRSAPRTGRRLLHGLSGATSDPTLETHLERWGAMGQQASGLLEELAASGLVGHGGAWFPASTKWQAVATGSRRRPVVVANGAEGEPASQKDALLLTCAPHLVLDGLALAAGTLKARRAIAYVPAASIPIVSAAVAERRARRLDPIAIEIFEAPDTYIAGQESSVVNALGGRREALPSFTGLTSIREHGVGGRPTLVQNAETLAHVALIGRFGAAWFREVGGPGSPGTMLLTVNRPGSRLVVEAVLGSSLSQATGLRPNEIAGARGILLGGYGGGWLSPRAFSELSVSEKAARRAGATLGAGVVAVLPRDVCPLAEVADVARYMESQGAGQCGPCVAGLAELADALERLAYGQHSAPGVERILEICDLVDGRGACRHPDGVARFVRTALNVFAEEVSLHRHRGPCPQTSAPRLLPVANRSAKRRLVSRS